MDKVREQLSKISTAMRSQFDASKRNHHINHIEEIKKSYLLVKGNMAKCMNEKQYHKAIIGLESFVEEEITSYRLQCNGATVLILSNMTLTPPLGQINRNAKEFIIGIHDANKHYLELSFAQVEQFLDWHSLLRSALAETIFNVAYKTKFGGSVSLRSVESAIKQCNNYLASGHPLMLRAKKIWNVKVEVHEALAKLTVNPLSHSQEDLWALVLRAEREQILFWDEEVIMLKRLAPRAFSAQELEEIQRKAKEASEPAAKKSSGSSKIAPPTRSMVAAASTASISSSVDHSPIEVVEPNLGSNIPLECTPSSLVTISLETPVVTSGTDNHELGFSCGSSTWSVDTTTILDSSLAPSSNDVLAASAESALNVELLTNTIESISPSPRPDCHPSRAAMSLRSVPRDKSAALSQSSRSKQYSRDFPNTPASAFNANLPRSPLRTLMPKSPSSAGGKRTPRFLGRVQPHSQLLLPGTYHLSLTQQSTLDEAIARGKIDFMSPRRNAQMILPKKEEPIVTDENTPSNTPIKEQSLAPDNKKAVIHCDLVSESEKVSAANVVEDAIVSTTHENSVAESTEQLAPDMEQGFKQLFLDEDDVVSFYKTPSPNQVLPPPPSRNEVQTLLENSPFSSRDLPLTAVLYDIVEEGHEESQPSSLDLSAEFSGILTSTVEIEEKLPVVDLSASENRGLFRIHTIMSFLSLIVVLLGLYSSTSTFTNLNMLVPTAKVEIMWEEQGAIVLDHNADSMEKHELYATNKTDIIAQVSEAIGGNSKSSAYVKPENANSEVVISAKIETLSQRFDRESTGQIIMMLNSTEFSKDLSTRSESGSGDSYESTIRTDGPSSSTYHAKNTTRIEESPVSRKKSFFLKRHSMKMLSVRGPDKTSLSAVQANPFPRRQHFVMINSFQSLFTEMDRIIQHFHSRVKSISELATWVDGLNKLAIKIQTMGSFLDRSLRSQYSLFEAKLQALLATVVGATESLAIAGNSSLAEKINHILDSFQAALHNLSVRNLTPKLAM